MRGKFISVETHGDGARASGDLDVRLGYGGDREAPTTLRPHARWTWDGTSLEVSTDALGFRPVFYCGDESRILVSDSPFRLLAEGAGSDLNEAGLGVFLRFGLFLDQETAFSGISCLPPLGRLEWRPGKLEVAGAAWAPPPRSLSRDEAIDGFLELYNRAVERALDQVDGEAVLPLSGGRDSRHLLLAMHRLGRPPDLCVTYNSGFDLEDSDVRTARPLCEAVGVSHLVLPSMASRISNRLRTMALTHLLSDEHSQMMPLRDAARGKGWTLFDGIAGDKLTRNKVFDQGRWALGCQEGRWESVAEGLMQGHQAVIGFSLQDLLGRDEVERRFPREQATARLSESMSRHATAADPFSAFMFWNRTRREIALAPVAVLDTANRVLCPYLDPDLVDYLLSLPPDVTRDGGFHDLAIARAYPEFSHLPFHDALVETRGRPGLAQRVLALGRGVGTLASLGPHSLQRGMSASFSRTHPRLSRELYRHYLMLIELAREPAGAVRLLRLAR